MTVIPQLERMPILSEKLRRSLEKAGAEGRTMIQLASELYGDSDYSAQIKTKQLILNLRKRGEKIIMVKDRGYQSGRYVLAQFM
jgi:hypothetical protein